MIEPIPLLIFSDAASASSGLARITRDLATRIHEHLPDLFRVATIGYGGASSSKLPWHQYSWAFNDTWIIHDLPEIWHDFAGNQKGVFMSIQDIGRMFWLARPDSDDCCPDWAVQRFLMRRPFKKWGYFPIDATGPNDKLSVTLQACVLGYDRILAYTKWAEGVLMRSIGISAADDAQLWNVPHGIDTSVFYPRGKKWRQMFGQLVRLPSNVSIDPDEVLVGIVATNQFRKDFGLAFEICGALSKKYKKFRVWVHTDSHNRHWCIPYLMKDFIGTGEHIISTGMVDDDSMAKAYSCCDLTLGIGNGEGFGYPIFESLACGVPCLHGNYGGAAEFLDPCYKIDPVAYRFESVYACQRAVYRAIDWIERAENLIEGKFMGGPESGESLLPDGLTWEKVWSRWESWLRKGAHNVADGAGDRNASMARMA